MNPVISTPTSKSYQHQNRAVTRSSLTPFQKILRAKLVFLVHLDRRYGDMTHCCPCPPSLHPVGVGATKSCENQLLTMSRALERERTESEAREAAHKHELQMVEELLNGRYVIAPRGRFGGALEHYKILLNRYDLTPFS